MDIRHLKYFIAVVEAQSFTKAAEQLFIAQPPLSRQIQNLEDELGFPLLERSSRPVKTTEAGYFFYQYAKKLLANMDQMITMTKKVASLKAVIRIGFVGSLLFGYLPPIIYQFRQLATNHDIELIEMGTVAQIEALKQGKIDIGFGRLKISDPLVKRVLLRKEPLVIAMHSSHALANLKAIGLHLADIVDETLLLFPNTASPNFASSLITIFSEHGLTPKYTKQVREVQLALGLVASGEGITIVPQSSMSIQMHDLIYVPLLDPDAISPIFMTFRHLENNPNITLILETIELIYQKHNLDFMPIK